MEKDYRIVVIPVSVLLIYEVTDFVYWLHELVKASARQKYIYYLTGIRGSLVQIWDPNSRMDRGSFNWIFTAVVAHLVDVTQVTVFDWKLGSYSLDETDNRILLRHCLIAHLTAR